MTTFRLTVLGIEVGEAEFGTFGGDEDLSVQGENHGLILHVDHASHHVPSMPAAPEQAASRVQTVTLWAEFKCGQEPDASPSESRRAVQTYPVAIKDESVRIRAELHVWFTCGSGPADTHVSTRHSLKFKVPFPGLDRVGPLNSKEADLVDADPLHRLT